VTEAPYWALKALFQLIRAITPCRASRLGSKGTPGTPLRVPLLRQRQAPGRGSSPPSPGGGDTLSSFASAARRGLRPIVEKGGISASLRTGTHGETPP
jgi:hypothetical protein